MDSTNKRKTVKCTGSVSVKLPETSKKLKIRDENVIIKASTQHFSEAMSEDFSQFFINAKFSDVKFKVGNREFKSHRIVLASISSKFATMFDQQPETNHIFTITDITADIFELLLKCVYKKNNIDLFVISEKVEHLLEASDKYRIHELKYKCEEFLGHQLTLTNVTNLMALADQCNAHKLKLKAFELIKNST